MDADRHRGRVVLITGAGSGMGRAAAIRFATEGAARVVLIDRAADRLEGVAAEVRDAGAAAEELPLELSDFEVTRQAVADAAARAEGLDVVISNAAAWTQEPFLEMRMESWRKVIDVSLSAGFVVAQEAARAMVSRGQGGVILFTASVSALGASPLFANYCAAKAGLVCLMQTMAIELAPHRIRVNAISPGPTDTQQSVDLVGEDQMRRWRENGFSIAPLGRLGHATDMAAAFSFLASEDASYVTGINLVVDGGLTAHAYSIPED